MKIVGDILRGKSLALVSVVRTASVFDALATMAHHDIGALVVLDERTLEGIFTERDYARKVALLGRSSKDVQVGQVMREATPAVRPDDTVETCMALMTDHRVRHLPVSDEGRIRGLVSIGDVVKALLDEQRFTIERLEQYITSC